MATKVTLAQIDAMYESLTYEFSVINPTLTLCAAKLPSGFVLAVGQSACVDSANYDREIGRTIAQRNAAQAAKNKLWELEGYVLHMTGSVSDVGKSILLKSKGWSVYPESETPNAPLLASSGSFVNLSLNDAIGIMEAREKLPSLDE